MFVLTFTAAVSLPAPAAHPAPTAPNVRAAIQRSLPYMEKVATAWMRERKCNSCHTVTFLVWSHNEAAARGLDVDRKKLAEWTKWSLADSLADQHWFGVRTRTIQRLRADGMPPALLAKLRPSGKNYTTQKDFLAAMGKVLGTEELKQHQENLLRRAALPNNGGGPDTLGQLLLGRSVSGGSREENDSYAAIRSLLVEWQEPDGSWQAQGQLPGLRWSGEKEMNQATTLWSLLAVSAGNPGEQALVRSKQQALEFLKKTTPGVTIQTLALHAIVAQRFGEPARAEALRKELLGRQNADGGWSWVQEIKNSNAFATGQVLYALGLLGQNENDPAVRQAWEFLLRTQGNDGGWDVPQEAVNTRRRGLNVYPYWGTAWAVIGLARTLPAQAK